MGPRTGLDGCGKSVPAGIQFPDSPVRSESLYRLNCPDTHINKGMVLKLDRLCGLVVRVSGYRYRGLGFDSRRYQIF